MAQVWFITGVSSGFGLEIALKALDLGHQVIGTVRSRQRAAEQVASIEGKGGKILELDVTNSKACSEVWTAALRINGHIDVLVNNAGMCYLGAVEDLTEEDLHAQLDVNLYGPYRLIKAALPGFRQRKSGTIVNVTSIAGLDGLPACGLYAASKFAVEGLSESLAAELVDYDDINVLIVEPGAFRTNFLGAFKAPSKENMAHYKPAAAAVQKFADYNNKQPGDPVKAAAAIIGAVSGQGNAGYLKGKVLRLPLGPDCVGRIEEKLRKVSHDVETSRKIAESTNIS